MINRVYQWLRFYHFLSGWYTNGHININLIFSPFRYFQTGFIISGAFLIFTRQEREVGGGGGADCRVRQKKMKSATTTAVSQEVGSYSTSLFFSFFSMQ